MEGSEQNLIKKNEDLCDEIILPNDVILNNKDLNMIDKENDLFGNQINKKSGLDNKITNYFKIEKNDNYMDIDE